MIRNDKKMKQGYLLGPYRIIRLIGEGGMGEVYEARDEVLNRQVALKVISPKLSTNEEIIRRFMSEGQALARLNHQNVVGVYALGEERGTHYIAMEYVDGYSLYDFLKLKNSLTQDEALHHFKQLLEGVKALHENGIIHRDIKPKNIIIRKDNSVKIVDFGIAKIQGQAESSLTATGELVGSLYYVAPEVIEGGEATVQSDIWSLGVNLYGMLTGKNPFEATKRTAVIDKITQGELQFPKDSKNRIPETLKRIVLKMCEKNPSRRYASVNEILLDIQGLKKGGLIPVPPSGEAGLVIGREEVVPQSLFSASFKNKSLKIRSVPRPRQYGAVIAGALLVLGGGWGLWSYLSNGFGNGSSSSDAASVALNSIPQVAANPSVATLNSPVNGQKIWRAPADPVRFEWSGGPSDLYLEVSKDRDFRKLVLDEAHPSSPFETRLLHDEGVYYWRLAQKNTGMSQPLTDTFNFTVVGQEGPHLIYPVSNIVYPDTQTIKFYWQEKHGAYQYRFQMATDIGFQKLFSDQLVTATQSQSLRPPANEYYWRVRAEDNPLSVSQWSEIRVVRVQMVMNSASNKTRKKQERVIASVLPAVEKTVVKPKKVVVPPVAKASKTASRKTHSKSGISYRTGHIHADQSNIQESPLSELTAKIPASATAPPTAPTPSPAPVAKPSPRKTASVPNEGLQIDVPKAKLPPNGASIVSLSGSAEPISFRWEQIETAEAYRVEISTNPKFSHVLYSLIVRENQLVLSKRIPKGKVYWRVRAEKGLSKSSWSTPFSFEIMK